MEQIVAIRVPPLLRGHGGDSFGTSGTHSQRTLELTSCSWRHTVGASGSLATQSLGAALDFDIELDATEKFPTRNRPTSFQTATLSLSVPNVRCLHVMEKLVFNALDYDTEQSCNLTVHLVKFLTERGFSTTFAEREIVCDVVEVGLHGAGSWCRADVLDNFLT